MNPGSFSFSVFVVSCFIFSPIVAYILYKKGYDNDEGFGIFVGMISGTLSLVVVLIVNLLRGN